MRSAHEDGLLIGHLYSRGAMLYFAYDPSYVWSDVAVPLDPIYLPLSIRAFSSGGSELSGVLSTFGRRRFTGTNDRALRFLRKIHAACGGIAPGNSAESLLLDLALLSERLTQWTSDGLFGLFFDGANPAYGATRNCPLGGWRPTFVEDRGLQQVRRNFHYARDPKFNYNSGIRPASIALRRAGAEDMADAHAQYLVPSPFGDAIGATSDGIGVTIHPEESQGYITKFGSAAAFARLAVAAGIPAQLPMIPEDESSRLAFVPMTSGALDAPGVKRDAFGRISSAYYEDRPGIMAIIPPYAPNSESVERDANSGTLTLKDSAGALSGELALPPCSSVARWALAVQQMGHEIDMSQVLHDWAKNRYGVLPQSHNPLDACPCAPRNGDRRCTAQNREWHLQGLEPCYLGYRP